MTSSLVTIPISQLNSGFVLQSNIFEPRDDRQVLLLAGGTKITPSLLKRLHDRGIAQVRVSPHELRRMMGGGPQKKTLPLDGPQPEYRPRRPGAVPYNAETAKKFVQDYRQSLVQVENALTQLADDNSFDGWAVESVTGQWLDMLDHDPDLFVALGVQPEWDKYPFRHALQVAMLAMSMARSQRLPVQELRDLTAGCLVHDAGMLMIDPSLAAAPRKLTDLEFLEITKHPTLVFDRLQRVLEVTEGVRMIVYQMHERCDGSGYPRQTSAARIHPFAKIAAVADVFLALASPRPHRKGMMPYFALEQIVYETNRSLFDKEAVRALLWTIGLFPIGSFVEMSDGRVGRVLRANGEQYTRPVVEIWASEDSANTKVVDLTAVDQDELQIARPMPELPEDSPPSPLAAVHAAEFWD